MRKYRTTGLLLAVIVIIVAVVLVFRPDKADAEEPTPDPCIPTEAWSEIIDHPAVTHDEEVFDYWQRYSWNGVWESNTEAPPFPNDRWQPNVQGDPHGIGVEGAYFMSHGNSGNGDWFYLQAVTKTVTVVDQEGWTETIEHPAVTCPEEPAPTETSTPVPTETPSVSVPTETPSVPEPSSPVPPVFNDGPTTICGITVHPPEPGMPIMRDILCTLPEIDQVDKRDPIIKTETSNKPTKTVKIFTHESGITTKSVVHYGTDIKEEGL